MPVETKPKTDNKRDLIASEQIGGHVSELLKTAGVGWDENGTPMILGQFKCKKTSIDAFVTSLGNLGSAGRRIVLDAYCDRWPIGVEILSGDDVIETFQKYRPGSCMRYEKYTDAIKMYAINPNVVRCLRWKQQSHLAIQSHMSGLLWVGGADKGYPILLDRVYAEGMVGGMVPNIIKGALEAIRREFPGREIQYIWGAPDSNGFWGEGSARTGLDKFQGEVTYTLENHGWRLPYLDSIHYGKLFEDDDGVIRISLTNSQRRDYVLCRNADCQALKMPRILRCCVDDVKITDATAFEYKGRLYGPAAFDRLFVLASYRQQYVLKTDLVTVTYRDRHNEIVTVTATQDDVDQDFMPLTLPSSFSDKCTHVHGSHLITIYVDGVEHYVDVREVLASTSKAEGPMQGALYVIPEFNNDTVVHISDAAWSDQLNCWLVAADKDRWESLLGDFNSTLLQCPAKHLDDNTSIVIHLFNGDPVFSVFHRKTSRCIIESLASEDLATRAATHFWSVLTERYPEVARKLRDLTNPDDAAWDIGCHGAVAVAISCALQSIKTQESV